MGGRCAVIVPDGVLFGSSRAHVDLRRRLVEENHLDGVISMPSGVFKPYAGVSTAVLLFTRGGTTREIWFYDMAADGFTLDDKRTPIAENDIPDLLECWQHRRDADFHARRAARMAELKTQIQPLDADRLALEAEINRLMFEQVLSPTGDGPIGEALQAARARLEELHGGLAPLRAEYRQLARQFWVSREQVRAHKYDLSASRYRAAETEAIYHEPPQNILQRMAHLEQVMVEEIDVLRELL